MPKLEHFKLKFHDDHDKCMNGPSSALNNVEIKIRGDRDDDDRNYNPAEDNHDEVVRCVARAISAVIKKLPNCYRGTREPNATLT